MVHHRPGRNYCSGTDSNARQDRASRTHPNAAADVNSLGYLPMSSVPRRSNLVRNRQDQYVVPNRHMAANSDFSAQIKQAADIDPAARPDHKLPINVAIARDGWHAGQNGAAINLEANPSQHPGTHATADMDR